MKRQRVDIVGVRVDRVTLVEAAEKIARMVDEGGRHYVVTPNPEFVVLAQRDREFRQILNQANLAVADGVGLLAAAKFLGARSKFKNKLVKTADLFLSGLKLGWWTLADQGKLDVLPKQVSGVDLVWHLAEMCAKKGYTMSFLGGKGGVADRAAKCLKRKLPQLKVGRSWDGLEADKILAGHLPKISTDILLVAFGHPNQEKWIMRNLKRLDVKVAMGVGGAFDFLAGQPRRAPLSFRRLGVEWIWRLIKEPRRWRRILTAFPYFPLLVFWRKIRMEVYVAE